MYRSQRHSPSISGTYSILQNGIPLIVGSSTDIPANTYDSTLANAFNNYYNSSEITVNQVQFSQLADQIIFSIYFIGILNPPDISIDVSNLAGGKNDAFELSVVVNRNYSNSSMYFYAVPLEFLRTA